MEPPSSPLITFNPAEFNARPLHALKQLDNELIVHPFYANKQKRKVESTALDLQAPLLGQFNLFKIREFPWDDQLVVLDIAPARLRSAGEDDFYIQDEKVLEVCRRGFCILLDRRTGDQRILRLGLRKFFYLSIEDLLKGEAKSPAQSEEKPAKEERGSKKSKGSQPDSKVPCAPDKTDPKIVKLSVDKLKAVSEKGVAYRVVGTSKLNGENLQLSYDGALKAWVVCSKNVTIVTRDFQDLERYRNNQVYDVALRIVEKWRDTVARIGEEKAQELKGLLAAQKWSLIGEICGNIKMMHPVHYETEDLYFYAISPCEFGKSCLNPMQSSDVFERFALRHIKPLFDAVIANPFELVTKVPQFVAQVNCTSADKIGEGVVLYFCGLGENQDAFLLSKVKSFEYVIYRKLRESFKHVLPKSGGPEEESEEETESAPQTKAKKKGGPPEVESYFANGKFSAAAHKKYLDLIPQIDKYAPDTMLRSLDFYQQMFIKAIQFSRLPNAPQKIWANFPCFVRALQYAMDKNLTLTMANIDQVISIVWSLSVRFYKVEPHLKMYPHVETVRSEALSNPIHGPTNTPKHVKVVIPITILGSGKSWIMERLACLYRDQGWVTFLVSSDELSAYVIERMRFKSNDWRESTDFFESSRKEYRDRWTRSMDHLFARPLGINAEKFVLLVDKNHHPFHFRKMLSEYQEKLTKLGFTCDFVHLFVDCPQPMAWTAADGSPISHPLNAKIFFDSLVRINGRTDNALMQNTTPESNLKILSEFFSFFIDYKPYPSKKDSVVFFKYYNDRDQAFAAQVDAVLGPKLREFVEAKKGKAKNTEALLAEFLVAFNKFLGENKDLVQQNLFPTTDDFEKCLKDNHNAFFGCHLKPQNPDLADIDGITYGGYFFEDHVFKEACDKVFNKILESMKDGSEVDPEAAQFIHSSLSHGIDQKKWVMVENPHMTSVYLGGQAPTKLDLEVWDRCHQHKNLHLDLMGLVVVAARLAFFIVSPSAARLTKNRMPHVSLCRVGKYTFYDSNRVGETLLDMGADFYSPAASPVATHLMPDLYEEGLKVRASVFRFPPIPILGLLRKMYG